MPQPSNLTGRVQSFLVLGALASADLAAVFPAVAKSRQELYPDSGFDADKFIARAKLALCRSGFSTEFVEAIRWDNFDEPSWRALKSLSEQLQMLPLYEGTDCPCYTELVQKARDMEQKTAVAKAQD